MPIALLGGTGDIGEGLALRLARDSDYDIIIGSRNAEKAEEKSQEYNHRLSQRGHSVEIQGYDNVTASEKADVVILSVPPEYAASTAEDVSVSLDDGDVLVCPAVQMNRDEDGFHYNPPEAGSVTEAVDSVVSSNIRVVGAFQNIAAGALTNLDTELHVDVAVTGNDADAITTVHTLIESIDGLRALDAGSLSMSAEVEAITPLLINIAMNNEGMHDLGVRFQ